LPDRTVREGDGHVPIDHAVQINRHHIQDHDLFLAEHEASLLAPRLGAMKIGVILPAAEADGLDETPGWPAIRSFARTAEARGLDSVWMFDHLFDQTEDGSIEGMHEAWTIVSAVAATTERVEIGTLVMCSSFRSPGLIAKMAVTADEVSDGRLILGLGAGWHDPEYDAFGFPRDHRVARFEEALKITLPLLRGERVTFAGSYHTTRDALLVPSARHWIPVLVAGEGPRMLRLAARYADAWNTAWYGAPNERLKRQLASLVVALEGEGRDPATIIRTVGMIVRDPEVDQPSDDEEFAGSVEELAHAINAYESVGIDHLIVLLQPMTEPSLDRLGAALERRADLDPLP
jgi:alkanesulfonate monooxygenase SsuD/methylene tetrahydromethanopterin reductase-like flavin-dependent oxidoreductase (luciferase family)